MLVIEEVSEELSGQLANVISVDRCEASVGLAGEVTGALDLTISKELPVLIPGVVIPGRAVSLTVFGDILPAIVSIFFFLFLPAIVSVFFFLLLLSIFKSFIVLILGLGSDLRSALTCGVYIFDRVEGFRGFDSDN